MHYVEHLINQRASGLWPVSDEQQALAAVEIEAAGHTIKHWRVCRGHDDAAIAASNAEHKALQEREADAIERLLRLHPLRVVIVHDNECEIDRHDMGGKLSEALPVAGRLPVSVAMLDIWVVLIVPGNDEFVEATCDTYDTDEKPSQSIPEMIRQGRGSLSVLGTVRTPRAALRLLADMWDGCGD